MPRVARYMMHNLSDSVDLAHGTIEVSVLRTYKLNPMVKGLCPAWLQVLLNLEEAESKIAR